MWIRLLLFAIWFSNFILHFLFILSLCDIDYTSEKVQNTKSQKQMVVKGLLAHDFKENQNTRNRVDWCVCNLGKYFLGFHVAEFLVHFQVRMAQVRKNPFCMLVLQTVVSEDFSQDFVKFLSVRLVKWKRALFLLLFFGLFVFLFISLLSIFFQINFIDLFFGLLLLWLIFLVNQLNDTSENDDNVGHVFRASEEILEDCNHGLQQVHHVQQSLFVLKRKFFF